MPKYSILVLAITVALTLPSMALAAERSRFVLFQVGCGLSMPSYPAETEDAFTILESQPGVERLKLSLDLALGFAVSQRAFMLGRVDGFADRLYEDNDYLQMNLYIYSIGFRYYPNTTGLHLEAGAGGTRGVARSSLGGDSSSDWDFGFGGARDWDFNPEAKGFGLTLEARYDSIELEGEGANCLMLTLNLSRKQETAGAGGASRSAGALDTSLDARSVRIRPFGPVAEWDRL